MIFLILAVVSACAGADKFVGAAAEIGRTRV
jgi:hypothetical protein